MNFKSNIYIALKYYNDFNAIKRNKIGKRLLRRAIGKATGRLMNKIIGR